MEASDADSVFQLRSDVGYRFIGSQRSRPLFDLKFPNELASDRHALLAICGRDNDGFVGEASFTVSDGGNAEFTVALLPEHRGYGFGPEASKALLSYARSSASIAHVVASVHRDNENGLKLVRALGFKDRRVPLDSNSATEWLPFELY